ncbi:hypothetical protein FRB90_005503, partial [Tulasnella sp. 427]
MSDVLLSRRLDRALDASQYLAHLFPEFNDETNSSAEEASPKKLVDLKSLSTWSSRDLKETGIGAASPIVQGRFGYLIIFLGQELDNGSKDVMMEDPSSGKAALIKVVEVLKVDDKTPLLVVQYRFESRSANGKYSLENYTSQDRVMGIQGTALSLMLLQRLLSLNSSRIPKGMGQYRSANLKTSFILPIGPIEKPDIARLARDLSCVVCGKQKCQTSDWAVHKKACNNLTNAVWSAMPFSKPAFFGVEGLWTTNISLYGTNRSEDSPKVEQLPKKGEEAIPPNLHGDNPFLVKVQFNGSPHMMVYDRTRTFDTWFNRGDNPVLFDRIGML